MSSQVPPAPSRRLQRVAELLKREVSELLRRELSVEQVGLLSVNEVKVSPDLKSATVFIGFVGNRQQRSAAPELLAQRAKRIQMMLGSQLSMKWTPVLNFLLDESVEKGNRVLAILESLEKGTPPGS
ncbi:MAG: 30S ribosome-binding factor RbfA [Verrucomicrobiota bacterium]